MPVEFLIDENMPMAIGRAILRHNQRGVDPIPFLKIGMADAPPTGTLDPQLLVWLEDNQRLLVSYDKKTLPRHFAEHLTQGRHVPGIFLFKPKHPIPFIIEYLAIVAHASDSREWVDRLVIVE